MAARERRLRAKVMTLLASEGFTVSEDRLVEERCYEKDEVRRAHSVSRQERLLSERPFVEEWLPRLSKYFASGRDVDPAAVDPVPLLVQDDEMAALFRVASLYWSIPPSHGYGRRFRIVVLDRSNGKLIGLLGLTDPVFNLRVRDAWVGWGVREREMRLTHVMDAHVLGAVPPYNQLLGAKLVALIAVSDFMRALFRKRYRGGQSVIRKRHFDGRLAAITVTSALGRSSIYNRLKFDGVTVYEPVGFTEGYGHFHVANGTYASLRKYLALVGDDEARRFKWGQGPNYRMRVVRHALEHLGLPPDLLKHGIRRGVYVAPLAKNSAAFLRGDASRLRWHSRPLADVIESWRERWLLPRAERDASYRSFDAATWCDIVRPAEKKRDRTE